MLGNSHLRAGDADREQMAAELARHCAEGRLSADELSERLETTYRSRTLGELAAVAGDLPRTAQRHRAWRPAPSVLAVAILALVALAAAGLLEAVVHSPQEALLGLVVLAVVILVLAVVLVPVVVAVAPFLAVAAAAVWAARRWGALERADRAAPDGRRGSAHRP